jgi:hypothetical protein
MAELLRQDCCLQHTVTIEGTLNQTVIELDLEPFQDAETTIQCSQKKKAGRKWFTEIAQEASDSARK